MAAKDKGKAAPQKKPTKKKVAKRTPKVKHRNLKGV